MLESLFIVAENGDVIYQKFYRCSMDRKIYVPFVERILKLKHSDSIPTVFVEENSAFVSVKNGDMYFVTITTQENSPSELVSIVNQIVYNLLVVFDKKLTVSFLKANIVRLYRVIEALTIVGYPTEIDPTPLKKSIKSHGAFMSYVDQVATSTNMTDKSTNILRNIKNITMSKNLRGKPINKIDKRSLSHSNILRSSSLFYDENEFFIDVFEYFNLLIDKNGQTIDMSVYGKVMADCLLSGMPLVEIHFSNSHHSEFDQVFLHPSVDKSKWKSQQIISLTPPDGKFTIAEYFYQKKAISLPIVVQANNQLDTTGDFELTANVSVKKNIKLKDLKFTIYLPDIRPLSHSFFPSLGKFDYNKASKIITWKIGDYSHENSMSNSLKFKAHFEINKSTSLLKQRPNVIVKVDFKCTKSSVTGTKISKINVTNVDYNLFKGVKYMNKARLFEIRFA